MSIAAGTLSLHSVALGNMKVTELLKVFFVKCLIKYSFVKYVYDIKDNNKQIEIEVGLSKVQGSLPESNQHFLKAVIFFMSKNLQEKYAQENRQI